MHTNHFTSKRRLPGLCGYAVLLLAAVTPAHAADRLTLQDALRHAYENNPTLEAARAQYKAVEERLPQAQAGWKPTVNANADITYTDVNNDGSTASSSSGDNTSKGAGVSFDQPLYRGGGTVARTGAARQQIAAEQASLRQTEQNVFLDVITAYMNVVRDTALRDLSINNRDVIGKQLNATRVRFEVGELTRTDVSQAEARLAAAESDVTATNGTARTANAVFEQVTGLFPERLAEPDYEALPLPETLDAAIAAAEAASPEILRTRAEYEASVHDIDIEKSGLLPAVGIEGGLSHDFDPRGSSDDETIKTVGVVASVPLYEAGAIRSRVRAARHTARQRETEITETQRAVHQRTVSAWESLQAARAVIESRKAQVEAARTANEGVQAEAEYGSRTVLDALDAEQELLDAKVALVSAQRDEVVARFSLLAQIGALTPGLLGFADAAPASARVP